MTAAMIAPLDLPQDDAISTPVGSPFDRVYEQIRQDILDGVLTAGTRLKIGDLASRYGTSTNPVREALQQLRGEGFVQINPNRGARVRPIDADFVRQVYEIETLVEPYLTRWFVGYVTDEDIGRLEAVQDRIEATGFDDPHAFGRLDDAFHRIVYERHYNQHAVELWWRHREILRAIGRRFPFSRSRRAAIVSEHRELIACIKHQDADAAAHVIVKHVEGSGRHLLEHMRVAQGGRSTTWP